MKKLLLKSMLLLSALIVGSGTMWGQTYKKVTSAPMDWSGEYVIVYETSNSAYVWTGVDANSNYTTATISNNIITKPNTAVSVTIASMTGGYSIKVNGETNNGKYISGTKDSNTTNFNASAVANTLTYSSGVDIASNTSHFVFNSTSGTTRYRYYKSATYSGSSYKKPQLYKLSYTVTYDANGGTGTMTDSNSPYFAGSTVTTKTNTYVKGGYEFTGWNTKADGSGTSYAEGAEFTLNENTTLYAQWTVAGAVALPTFSVAEGIYNVVQSIVLTCSTPSSSIYYTTDGTEPTTSSSVYTSPIAVNQTTTIKAFAIADGLTDSNIASATYILKCATPTITIPEGVFVSSKVLTMASVTEGAAIYYTTDGSTTPTSISTAYDSSNKPSIDATTTIKAVATKSGWSDSDIATETFTKETVLEGIDALNAATTSSTATVHYVKLTDAQITYVDANGNNGFLNDANAGIYLYGLANDLTLNTKYNGVYKITSKTYNSWPEVTIFETIAGEGSSEVTSDMTPVEMTASDLENNFSDNISRQIRIKDHTLSGNKLTSGINLVTSYISSSLTENGTYTLIGYPSIYNSTKRFNVVTAYPKPAAPTFDPVEGEFSETFTLHLACATDGVAIYYTTDGTTPTTSSTLYNDATGIVISTADVTVKAIAYYQDMTSDVASATYTYRAVAKPLFGTASGTEVYYGTKVTVTCATDGADIYYTLTTDGNEPTDPTNASKPYPDGGIAINANTVKIKVVAEKNGDYSSIAAATYTLKNPAAPTFSTDAGAVARNTVVTINSAEGTTIYYTTDGSDADKGTDSGSNSVNITIDDAMTLKAIAIDPELNMSTEVSAAYTIAQVAPPVIGTAAGMLAKGTQVTITTATDGATIYYTVDGTIPTASSNVYNGYVVINKECTLKTIALKENYIDSEVASAAYTVAGASESFLFSALGYSNGDEVENVGGTEVTITFSDGGGSNVPKYYTDGSAVRIYNKNTVNIASGTKNITAIVFTFSSTSYNKLSLKSGESGTLTDATKAVRTWTGNDNDITFVYSQSSGQSRIQKIEVFYELTDDNVTVGSSKLVGFCSEYKLDFSATGLSAYKAKVSGGKVVLTKVEDGIVPANTGVVLSGDANDYDLPISTADVTTDFSDNEMMGVTQRTQVLWNPSTDVYNYILQGGEFKKASTGYLKANRAYLSTSYDVSAASARDYMEIVFEDDDVTAIETVKTQKMDGQYYNLNGQKVQNPTKGLYIVNGKKVVVK